MCALNVQKYRYEGNEGNTRRSSNGFFAIFNQFRDESVLMVAASNGRQSRRRLIMIKSNYVTIDNVDVPFKHAAIETS